MKKWQNTVTFSMSAVAALVLAACSPSEQKATTPAASGEQSAAQTDVVKRVSIATIIEHPALDSIRKGVIDELKTSGFEDGKNLKIDFQSAQGSTATVGQIAKKFAGDNPDVIVAIATGLDWWSVMTMALQQPQEYSRHLLAHHAQVAAFGGAFLLLVFLIQKTSL